MATYVNELIEKFIPEKEVREAMIVPNPVPDNIHKVIKLDDFLADIMKEKKEIQPALFLFQLFFIFY